VCESRSVMLTRNRCFIRQEQVLWSIETEDVLYLLLRTAKRYSVNAPLSHKRTLHDMTTLAGRRKMNCGFAAREDAQNDRAKDKKHKNKGIRAREIKNRRCETQRANENGD
jgi:hypothetical protein